VKKIADILCKIISDILVKSISDIRELTEQAFFGKSSYTDGCKSMKKLRL